MKINQLKAGALLSYISMAVGYLVSVIYTPVMLRLLGQNEYGLYNLATTVVAYLGVLNFGFGSAYIRYYSKYRAVEDKENIKKLNGMFFVIFSVIGIVSVIAGIILALNADYIFGPEFSRKELAKAKTLLLILVVNLGMSFPTIVFNSNIIANEMFIYQKILQMVKIVVNPFIVLPFLLMGYGSIGMVIATVIFNILIEIFNAYFCIKKLKMKFSFSKFDFGLMKKMTVFSSYIFMNMIIDQINWNVDKFIIGRYQGSIAVAIYGLAAQLNIYYMGISTAISNVFVPRVHRMVATNTDNSELTNLFIKVARIQFVLLFMVGSGLVFFGEPFIRFWVGSDYKGSYPIVLLLSIPATIPLIQNLGIEIQKAKNIHQFRSILYFGVAIVNLAVSIPLTKLYGGVGAAIGTAFAQVIGNTIIMNIYYQKKVGINIKMFWVEISKFIPALVLPITFGTVLFFNVNLSSFFLFIVSGVLYIIIYMISLWYLGLNRFEKDLICGVVIKIKKRNHNGRSSI